MFTETLEDIVRKHIPFVHGASNNWNKIYCEVCGDGSRKKGPRGGWRFSEEMTFYHCFNCGINASHDPNREHPFSKDMYKTLESFGIPKAEYIVLGFADTKSKPKKPVNPINEIKTLELPEHFYKLVDAGIDNVVAINAIKFLNDNYGLTERSYNFFLSTGISNSGDPTEVAMAKCMVNRIIIPYFKGNNLIYYEARDITNKRKQKYISPSIPKSSILFNMDELYNNINSPLFIFEGAFNAIHFNAIACMENNLSKQQIDILNRSPRKKIVVPDRHGDSNKLAEIAIKQGWSISLPETGTCKDISDAIIKYGKIYVTQSMVNNVYDGFSAQIALNIL